MPSKVIKKHNKEPMKSKEILNF